ncbi:MAG: Gfo/Idh/MocA family oxidoreductase [Hungatella sp.]
MKKVITYGTFDLFHEGHYNLLERAKALGDYLIVGVTTEHFDEIRGKVNVIDSILERIDNVRRTGFADEIIVEDHEGQKIEDIQRYGADIFTVGSDWIGTFDYLRTFCDVIYLERTPDISSTQIRKNKFHIVKTGIIGTGRIAPRFVAEAKYVSGINIICAYNPEKESANEFSKVHHIKCYTGGYEAFLKKVDAVYIASPHETHYDYAKRALHAGVHVLCEKPMTFTEAETIELYRLAKEQNCVLMEGIKAAYCPGFQQIINVAKSGKIGKICDVEACFSRLADPMSREVLDQQYGGAFLEFGGHTMLPVMKLLGTDYEAIQIDSIWADNGIDLYTKIQFRYPNALGLAKTGVGVKSEGQLVIAGTKGYILAQSPWWLTKRFEVRYEDANVVERYEPNFQGDGLRYEISEFVSKINNPDVLHFKLTPEECIAMARVTECFMKYKKQHDEDRMR